jgi:hypothetical protein
VCQPLPKRMTVDCTVTATASSTNVANMSTASRDFAPSMASTITSRCKRMLRAEGLRTATVDRLPRRLNEEIKRELRRLELVLQMIKAIETERDAIASAKASTHTNAKKIQKLVKLRGIGAEFATVLVMSQTGAVARYRGERPDAMGFIAPGERYVINGFLAEQEFRYRQTVIRRTREGSVRRAPRRRLQARRIDRAHGEVKWRPLSPLATPSTFSTFKITCTPIWWPFSRYSEIACPLTMRPVRPTNMPSGLTKRRHSPRSKR